MERLKLHHVFVEDNEEGQLVAFADHHEEPSQYLIFQRAKAASPEDRTLGMDKTHITFCEQSRSCYGGVSSIDQNGDSLTVRFNEKGRRALRIDGELSVQVGKDWLETWAILKRMYEADDGIS